MLYEYIFASLMVMLIIWDFYIIKSVRKRLSDDKKEWPKESIEMELSAAELWLIYNRYLNLWKMVMATIIELAIKGHIYISTERSFFRKKIFLELIRKELSGLNHLQKRILNSLFIKSTKVEIRNLRKPTIKTNMMGLDIDTQNLLKKKGLIEDNKFNIGAILIYVGFLLTTIAMGIFIQGQSVLKYVWILGSMLNLFIGTTYMVVASKLRLTDKGKMVYNSYSELKEKLMSLDQLDQRTYETFLPYAYSFLILYEWTNKAKELGTHKSYWHDEKSPKQILNIIEEIYDNLDIRVRRRSKFKKKANQSSQ